VRVFLALGACHWLGDCYGGIWPIFKYLAGLDLARAGFIATVTMLLGAGLQPLFGVWSDRGAQRGLVLWGAGLASAGMLLGPVYLIEASLSPLAWYGLMLLIMLIVRVGQGMYHPSATSAAGNLNSNRRSMFVSMFIAAGMFGFAISQGLFSFVFGRTGAHTEIMLIPAAMILLLGWAWCRPAPIPREDAQGRRHRISDLAAIRRPLLILFVFEVMIGGWFHGIIFLMPEFLEQNDYPVWMVQGTGYFFWVAGSATLMIIAGHLSDRFRGTGVLTTFTGLGLLVYFAAVLSGPIPWWAMLVLLFVAGGCIGSANPMAVAMGQRLDPRHTSLISGILMGLAWAVASPADWIVGVLAQQPALGITGALLILGVAGVFALALALLLSVAIRTSKGVKRHR
jgi:FSR family fosmidomycin resistance protein-like MFS transporter